eukprot:TRINITY_DN1564_c0_g1_i1.p1 TRINITY_DN1564_c0_g1~~TRINITY_DN1564_c0_g1_i1.p1  ORF type:complete len:493 (-),score=93.53 TRINITY_DN1564_c0_g1_i1:2969-4447(-)
MIKMWFAWVLWSLTLAKMGSSSALLDPITNTSLFSFNSFAFEACYIQHPEFTSKPIVGRMRFLDVNNDTEFQALLNSKLPAIWQVHRTPIALVDYFQLASRNGRTSNSQLSALALANQLTAVVFAWQPAIADETTAGFAAMFQWSTYTCPIPVFQLSFDVFTRIQTIANDSMPLVALTMGENTEKTFVMGAVFILFITVPTVISSFILLFDSVIRLCSQAISKVHPTKGTIVTFSNLCQSVFCLTSVLGIQVVSGIINYYDTFYFFLIVSLLGGVSLLTVALSFLQAIARIACDKEKQILRWISIVLIGGAVISNALWMVSAILVNFSNIAYNPLNLLFIIVPTVFFRLSINAYYLYAHCSLLKNLNETQAARQKSPNDVDSKRVASRLGIVAVMSTMDVTCFALLNGFIAFHHMWVVVIIFAFANSWMGICLNQTVASEHTLLKAAKFLVRHVSKPSGRGVAEFGFGILSSGSIAMSRSVTRAEAALLSEE